MTEADEHVGSKISISVDRSGVRSRAVDDPAGRDADSRRRHFPAGVQRRPGVEPDRSGPYAPADRKDEEDDKEALLHRRPDHLVSKNGDETAARRHGRHRHYDCGQAEDYDDDGKGNDVHRTFQHLKRKHATMCQ